MRRRIACLLIVTFLAFQAFGEIEITLKNSFIEKFKNRATISTNMIVDKAHKRPNAPSKDGDLHFAGRATEVGLPIVAEMMNARDEVDAVGDVHAAEGSGDAIPVVGAWRLWCEHGGNSTQTQGAALQPFTSSNPDHVFEIHPTTTVGDEDTGDAFRPINGFRTKDAHDAFTSYENTRCRIRKQGSRTKITTVMGGYNYVEFIIKLNDDPELMDDGAIVFGQARDLEDELLVRNRRMIFVKGTPPYERVKDLRAGDKLHVIGIPRINLALVSWRTRNGGERPEVLTWNLPYEMIIAGVYDDNPPADDE